ncbi:MAG: asparagine synthase (glutamine-hydrolyzing), partial [Thermoleophilia bacterium]|nr:asparagine synthase (glutamine-hydrolyzing) [Thermoleophilia bacterium]
MCGIAGIVDFERRADPACVERMIGVLEHRGPDGQGVWADNGVALGHRRLSIIDLTEGGHQPMVLDNDRYVITFNGEIYNYVELREELRREGYEFHSSSDTEVLLVAYSHWGEDCLHKLNGMFAFAIWDNMRRVLFCARDRLGVKPFVYSYNGRRFGFASETKALLAAGMVKAELRPDAVYEYLARGYTSNGRSFYAGVEVLEPGCSMTLDSAGRLNVRTWWEPDRSVDESIKTREEWAERIAELVDDAVRLRLRSDVPVGAHLSGGLDSSAVVAAAARHGGAEIHTFTGAFLDDDASDERAYSRAVNAKYDLTAHEIEITVDDLPRSFARILWHMDEPIAGEGVFPQLMVCDLAAQHGFTVVLGGQGGDELFGGYLRHRALHYKRVLSNGSPVERGSAFLELTKRAAGEWRRVVRSSTRVSDDQLAPSFLASIDPDLRAEVRRSRLSFASARDLMWHDLRTYLPALLHVEDRTSMAASIESRTPLLDWRLVELSLRIPEKFLFAPGEPKPLLKQAVGPWLPDVVTQRRDKKGFPTPLGEWKRQPELRSLVEALTTPGSATAADLSWSVSGERSHGRTVFSDDYLGRRDSFKPSELWTVLTVNGWLSRLEAGALGAPMRAAA